jgi:hypothetical protein
MPPCASGPYTPRTIGIERRRRQRRRRRVFLGTTKVEDFDRWWSVFFKHKRCEAKAARAGFARLSRSQ